MKKSIRLLKKNKLNFRTYLNYKQSASLFYIHYDLIKKMIKFDLNYLSKSKERFFKRMNRGITKTMEKRPVFKPILYFIDKLLSAGLRITRGKFAYLKIKDRKTRLLSRRGSIRYRKKDYKTFEGKKFFKLFFKKYYSFFYLNKKNYSLDRKDLFFIDKTKFREMFIRLKYFFFSKKKIIRKKYDVKSRVGTKTNFFNELYFLRNFATKQSDKFIFSRSIYIHILNHLKYIELQRRKSKSYKNKLKFGGSNQSLENKWFRRFLYSTRRFYRFKNKFCYFYNKLVRKDLAQNLRFNNLYYHFLIKSLSFLNSNFFSYRKIISSKKIFLKFLDISKIKLFKNGKKRKITLRYNIYVKIKRGDPYVYLVLPRLNKLIAKFPISLLKKKKKKRKNKYFNVLRILKIFISFLKFLRRKINKFLYKPKIIYKLFLLTSLNDPVMKFFLKIFFRRIKKYSKRRIRRSKFWRKKRTHILKLNYDNRWRRRRAIRIFRRERSRKKRRILRFKRKLKKRQVSLKKVKKVLKFFILKMRVRKKKKFIVFKDLNRKIKRLFRRHAAKDKKKLKIKRIVKRKNKSNQYTIKKKKFKSLLT